MINEFLNGNYKGEFFFLFYTVRCGSCAETHAILEQIMQSQGFISEKLLVIDAHFHKRLEFVTKYKVNGYPCLIRTKDTLLLDVYTGGNIIKVFQTGLI